MSAGAEPRIAAIVLAAGHSARMRGANKLLEDVGSGPMVEAVVAGLFRVPVDPVLVVTGYDAEAVEASVGPSATVVRNPHHEEGIGASVRAGIGALDASIDAALVCLGDMPAVSPRTIRRLLEAFRRQPSAGALVPIHAGRRGNPVLWSSAFFPELSALRGDVGARHLLTSHVVEVREIAVDDPGVLMDVDTPRALREMRASLRAESG